VRFVLFYHSLISDWNHGNAHFLRGIACELLNQGHTVDVYEPANGWSLQNLLEQHGTEPVEAFHEAYPQLTCRFYDRRKLDVDRAIEDADVVIVHEWNAPILIERIGITRRDGGRFKLFFHDTHHRAISAPDEIRALDLRYYDGVLAFGEVIRRIYLDHCWTDQAWTWHEAADTTHFTPAHRRSDPSLDVVWVGNWGDDERSAEISTFLIEPVRALGLRARVHGVRYPEDALAALQTAGIEYAGWIPNFRVPDVFADAASTVHIPRRFYSETLPGVPTIRVFEALACGIPLVSAPWEDSENLFHPGKDFLVAENGREMRQRLQMLVEDKEAARAIAEHGLQTILSRHTCAHRVHELVSICESLSTGTDRPIPPCLDPDARRSPTPDRRSP
jgi:spore maturation protein CgeB